jgi:hypothetical protein
MGQKIAHGHLSGDRGVGQFEVGIQFGDAAVPAHATHAHRLRYDRRSDGLGKRSELEDGIGVHLTWLTQLLNTVPFQEYDLILVHHRYGNAGHPGLFHRRVDIAVKLADCTGNISVCLRDSGLRPRGNHCRTGPKQQSETSLANKNHYSSPDWGASRYALSSGGEWWSRGR